MVTATSVLRIALVCALLLCVHAYDQSRLKQSRPARSGLGLSTSRAPHHIEESSPSSRTGRSKQPSSVLKSIFAYSTTNVFRDFRDEVVDCVDSLVFAVDNRERLDNAKAIVGRHKGKLIAGAGALLVVRALSQKRVSDVAVKFLSEQKMAERARWGPRKI